MIKSVRYIICVAAFVPVAAQSVAQRVMTVEQCVSDALANNVKIKNAANDVEASEETKKSAFTKYFPTVSATGSGYMADKGLVEMDMGQGMKMSMLKNGIIGGVSAQMPLFTGGRILNSNRLADTGVEVSRLQQRLTENEVVLTAETYFWQVVMLKEKLKTVAAVERQLDEFSKDAEASVSAGVSDRNDLLQVKLKGNSNKSDRISLENSLNTALRLLAQYTGHDGDSIDVSVELNYSMPQSPLQLYAEPSAALQSTAEYELLEQNVKASKLKYKITLGQNMPSVAVGGGYFYDNLMDKMLDRTRHGKRAVERLVGRLTRHEEAAAGGKQRRE